MSRYSKSTTEKELKYAFAKYGKVLGVSMKNGFAFVDYDDYEDACIALKKLNNKSLRGQSERLVVEASLPKEYRNAQKRRTMN